MRTPVSVAVVGVGGRSPALARTFETVRPCELRWVCDEAWTSGHGRFRRAARLENVLDDETLDAVAIVAPPAARGELVRRALDAGKHVLVEPPFTLEGRDADELVRKAADGNLRLVSSSTLRFHPAASRFKELIATGRLGELYYLSASRLDLASRADDDESVLWTEGAHALSLLLWLVGDEPLDVAAHGGPCGDREAADIAFCHLRFATGIEAELRLSRLEPQPTLRVTAVGSKGMSVLDELGGRLPLTIHKIARDGDGTTRSGDVVAPRLPEAAPLRDLCEHFLATVSAPGLASDTGRSGAAVVAVLEALQRSLEQGGTRVATGAQDAPAAGVIRLPLRSV
jgi:predicted dehydrogenase